MVRQWQELLHGGRYSESYTAALPDFVKLAESFHAVGLRATEAAELDDVIREMLAHRPARSSPTSRSTKDENCFPMIPSGAAHNEMILGAGAAGRRRRRDRRGHGPGLTGSPLPFSPRRRLRPARASSCRIGVPHGRPVRDHLRNATIAVLVENEAGILARVIGLFSGRGYNIESLTVAAVDADAPAVAHHHRHLRHRHGDRADQGAARPAGAGAQGQRPDAGRPARRARAGADQGGRHAASTGWRRCAWPMPSAPAWSTRRPRASSSR